MSEELKEIPPLVRYVMNEIDRIDKTMHARRYANPHGKRDMYFGQGGFKEQVLEAQARAAITAVEEEMRHRD